MLQFLKTKTFRISAVIVVLLALYVLLGFVIAPKLVRSALLEDIPETLAVTPSIGEIHINPFLFQVTVDDFSLAGAGGEKLLGFQAFIRRFRAVFDLAPRVFLRQHRSDLTLCQRHGGVGRLSESAATTAQIDGCPEA